MTLGAVAIAAGPIAGPEGAAPAAITGQPTITTLVAFSTDPNATPVWSDISDRMYGFTVNRGRQRELDRFSAGRLSLTLNNEDRAFDPTYTSSPYYPNVVPMRRIKIQATAGGVTYDVFTGYVDSWNQQYQHPQSATCTVEATDAFKFLANAELLSSAYAEEVNTAGPTLWYRLGDPSGAAELVESVSGTFPFRQARTPTLGASSLNPYDSNGAVGFPTALDGVYGVFPEGTWPISTAATLEIVWRYTSGLGGNPWAIAVVGTLPPSNVTNTEGMLALFIDPSGNLLGYIIDGAGGQYVATSSGVNLSTGGAHHLAATWTSGQPMTLYIDGVDRTANVTGTFSGTLASTTRKWVAAVNSMDYAPFTLTGIPSTADEYTVYTRALTASEIASHAAARTSAWANELSGARIHRVLDVTPWPAADRYIDAGLSTLQPATLGGSVLAYLQKVEETEQGSLFIDVSGKVRFIARDSLLRDPYATAQGTFGDVDPELEYGDLSYVYDDQMIYNEAVVNREGGIAQVVGDAASQSRYLRRTKVFDGMLFTTDGPSRDLANWFVGHYKEPLLRTTNMRLEPSAGNWSTHFPQVLARDLMERVIVKRKPQNLGTAINQPALIEGITHEVTAMEWKTTWNLSPAETQVYWILGQVGASELGSTTKLGF